MCACHSHTVYFKEGRAAYEGFAYSVNSIVTPPHHHPQSHHHLTLNPSLHVVLLLAIAMTLECIQKRTTLLYMSFIILGRNPPSSKYLIVLIYPFFHPPSYARCEPSCITLSWMLTSASWPNIVIAIALFCSSIATISAVIISRCTPCRVQRKMIRNMQG